ncbi:MAG: C25 family cysteine peptidase [Bacteroidota bacterium]|nr:C25 family cysteine peptidase [Bacteroidota bacterium]MDP4234406.1 C25 family cysteine peptidase [Bacteroidota bacterium]MDP4243338.1 C25 family cysteine peptidase [Bacteroidota bacterium]MDP4288024.1 C25 family cysteine peptidase [Bacteroidota bacterium]
MQSLDFLRGVRVLVAGAVLGVTSGAHAQVSRVVPKARPVYIAAHEAAKVLTPYTVSSHVRAGKHGSQGRPIVRRITPPSRAANLITDHTTKISQTNGQIALVIALGPPIIEHANAPVKNAPANVQFDKLIWPSLANAPNGFTIESAAVQSGPEYPVLALTVAVPESANNFTPVFEQLTTMPMGNLHLAPAASKTGASGTDRVYDPRSAGASWSFTPSLGSARTFRSLRTITVRVPLLSSKGGAITALGKFRIGLTFTVPAGLPPSSAQSDPLFAALNSHLVANSWDLAQFRVPLRPSNVKPFALAAAPQRANARTAPGRMGPLDLLDSTSFGWIDTNANYLKLSVSHDGLYRLTASEIATRTGGFELKQIFTPQNLRCMNRGVEIPIWIDTDAAGNITAIEFYGEHLHGVPLNDGQPEYYNLTTDTNAYWLTNSSRGDKPLRYVGRTPNPALASATFTTGEIKLHHERDYFYYFGDSHQGQDEQFIHPTTYTPGERFEWYEIHGPLMDSAHLHLVDTFIVTQLPADMQGKRATFQILARGMTTANDHTVQHRVIARVNGVTAHDAVITDFGEDTSIFSIPLSQLTLGVNTFEMTTSAGQDEVDEYYFDHYTIDYEGGLAPNRDTGFASGQWRFQLQPTSPTYQIALTSTDEPHLYNMSDGTRVLPQSGAFVDSTLSTQPNYVAATSSSFLSCDRIELWHTAGAGSWNILRPTNHADYIIITHPAFLLQAQMLAVRRTKAGLASMVVTTDEVYNAFGYGSGEIDAIRRFLSYAYYFYQGQQSVPVGYVTLFGAGTYDPKLTLNNVFQANDSRSVERTFIPTYGWPVSDFYFTLADVGRIDAIQPRMVISRIPVSSTTQADAYLSKLQAYEDNSPADWNRQFTFVIGGSNTFEFGSFVQQIHSFVDPPPNGLALPFPPTNIRYKRIDRDSNLVNGGIGSVSDPSKVAVIHRTIEDGTSLLYFAGHGATFLTDPILPDPVTLHNKNIYPFLFTVSCRTGAYGEPNLVSLNESYVLQPDAGSAVAYGTTGFGEIYFDGLLSYKFFELLRHWREDIDYPLAEHDTSVPMRMNLASMLTASKLYAADSGAAGDVGLNSRFQYCMLGDAAVGFALRPQPELAVHASEIAVSTTDGLPKTSFSVSDSVLNISALVHNYGYAAEIPVVVRIEDAGPTGVPLDFFDTLPRLDDTVRVFAQLHLSDASTGEHIIRVSVDPDRHFRPFETDTTDDDASQRILINGLSATPFYPWEGARAVCDVSANQVHFIVLFPPRAASRMQFELDTTRAFAHPILTRDTAAGTRFFGTLDVSLTGLPVPASSVYWWRTRIIRSTGDTSAWQSASFSTASAPRAEFSYASTEQLASTIVSGLAIDPAHGLFLPIQDTIRYDVISHGVNDSGVYFNPVSQIFVNDRSLFSYAKQGYVIARLTKDGGGIDTAYEFSVDWTRNGDSNYTLPIANAFDSVIASLPDSTWVIVLTNLQPAFNFITYNNPSVLQAMSSIGAKDGLNVPYFGSFALMGKKGWLPGMAREAVGQPNTNGVHISDTIVTFGTSGLALTPFTAVARKYGMMRITGNVSSGRDILVTVLGSRRDGLGVDAVDTLRASQSSQLDLSHIDPRTYDRLGLRMDFTRGSNSAQSPELHAVELEYDAAPEFAFTADTVTTTPSSIAQGGTIAAAYTMQTLTCDSALNVPVILVGSRIAATDTIAHTVPQLKGHTMAPFIDSINTTNTRGFVPIVATVNLHESQNEQLLFNDAISGAFTVTRDSLAPHAEILFDNNHIPPCGYVSSNDTTIINLYSPNFIRLTDTNSIKATFQRDTEYYPEVTFAKPQVFRPDFKIYQSGPLQAQLILSPGAGFQFKPGQWNVTATIQDGSGNVDTVHQCFTVSATNGLDHVMNYPNPFKDKTAFTFVLLSNAPADVKVIVYTVAGRKIRTLTPIRPLRAGMNMIEWDGRDEVGNEVGNGTYLYRLTLNGKNPDGSDVSDAVTEKAVRSR